MSMMYCNDHDSHFDTDFDAECPECQISDEPNTDEAPIRIDTTIKFDLKAGNDLIAEEIDIDATLYCNRVGQLVACKTGDHVIYRHSIKTDLDAALWREAHEAHDYHGLEIDDAVHALNPRKPEATFFSQRDFI